MITIEGVKSEGRVGHYERKGLYALEEVFPYVSANPGKRKTFDGDVMSLGNVRYRLFKARVTCVMCDLRGEYFAKERAVYLDRKTGRWWPNTLNFHFNLYGRTKEGREVMLTRDHIHPKSLGGSNDLSNSATMCARCNSRKKDRLPTESPVEYAQRKEKEKIFDKQRRKEETMGIYTPSQNIGTEL